MTVRRKMLKPQNLFLPSKPKPNQPSKPFLHPRRHRPQIPIDFTRRRAQYETHNRLSRNVNILKASQNMDLLIRKNDSGAGAILDGVFRTAIFACYAADCTGEICGV
jgi:hypothetical protein